MEYTSEVIERIRATKAVRSQESIGIDLANFWIVNVATYDQITSIAVGLCTPEEVVAWIVNDLSFKPKAELFASFSREVCRFWDEYKGII